MRLFKKKNINGQFLKKNELIISPRRYCYVNLI